MFSRSLCVYFNQVKQSTVSKSQKGRDTVQFLYSQRTKMHRCFLFMLLCSITSNGETYDEKFERDNVLCLPSDQDQPSSCNKCVDANCDWIVLPDMLTRLCTTTWDDADGYFDDAEPTDVVQDMELDAETDPLSYLFRATQDPLQCDDEPFETISARRPAKTSSFPIEKDPNTNGGNSDPNPEGNGGTSSNSSSKSKFPKGLLFGGPIAITMLVAMVVGYRTWRVRRQTYNPSHSVPEPVELTEVAVTAAYRYGLDSITEENDNEPRASNSSSTATSERASMLYGEYIF